MSKLATNNLQRLGKADLTISSLLFLVVALGGLMRMAPNVVGNFHDDGVYLATAKSLAENFDYLLLHLPGEPAQTKYPLLFSLLLSFVWSLFSDFPANGLFLKTIPLFSAALAVALSYLYLVRFCYSSRFIAGVASVMSATSVTFLYYGSNLLSEMPFALFSIISFWGLEIKCRSKTTSRFSDFKLGILFGMTTLCRMAGLLLFLPAVVVLVAKRERVLQVVVGFAVVILPWIAWVVLTPSASDSVIGYHTDYLSWFVAKLPELSRAFFYNLVALVLVILPLAFGGILELVNQLFGNDFAGLLSLLNVFLWVSFGLILRQKKVLPLTLAGYLLLVCLWPWPPGRFVVPFLPLVLSLQLEGLANIVRRLPGKELVQAFSLLVVGVLLGANIWSVRVFHLLKLETGYPYTTLPADKLTNWSSYETLFEWIKKNTNTEDTLIVGFDSMTYLYTGRKAVRPFIPDVVAQYYSSGRRVSDAVPGFIKRMKKHYAAYFVLTPMPGYTKEVEEIYQLERELLANKKELLQQVYVDSEDPRFRVYRILKATL